MWVVGSGVSPRVHMIKSPEACSVRLKAPTAQTARRSSVEMATDTLSVPDAPGQDTST